MAVGTVVMVSSYRLGAGWAKNVGPDSGYFPFYVALIMFCASGVTLVQNLLRRDDDGGSFVERRQLKMVLQVLIPMTIFVVLSIYIGIYISTFLFIGFFMTWHGRYPVYKTLPGGGSGPGRSSSSFSKSGSWCRCRRDRSSTGWAIEDGRAGRRNNRMSATTNSLAVSGAVDLKVLHRLPQTRCRNFKSKAAPKS